MDANTPIRLRVIAADESFSRKLISALRQDSLDVTAASLPDLDTLTQEMGDAAWDLLLIIAHPDIPVQAILDRVGQQSERLPLLLLELANADLMEGQLESQVGSRVENMVANQLAGTNLLELVSEVISHREIPRIVNAVRHHGAYQQAIKDNQRLTRQLREMTSSQQQLLDHCGQAIALVKDGNHLYCNPAYTRLFGDQTGQCLPGTAIANLISEADRPRLNRLLAQEIPEQDWVDLSGNRNGEEGMLRFTCRASMYADEHCLQVTVTQAPGNQKYARRKQQMARQDLITRLDNLSFFHARLESAIATAINKHVQSILLVVQIEHFSEVRQSLGNTATNAVLGEISDFLHQAISKPFTASRLADDEFGILLFKSTMDDGMALADYIRNKVGNAATNSGNNLVRLSVTVGIAALNEHALDAEAMLSRARMNRKLTDADPDNFTNMTARLNNALDNNRLSLVYQPVLAFRDDGRERYEVLVRLHDDDGKTWLPDTFLPHANINNLGEAVDRQVLSMMSTRPALVGHSKRHLLIHLSSNTLANLTLLPWLNKRLGKSPQLTERLIIQINEIDLLNNADQVGAFAACLEKLGIGICLNRFGIAVDPLSAIRDLKPAMVRLDDALIRDILYSQQQQNTVRKLIRAVHHEHVSVAVTRIEDMEFLPLLWDLGVDFVQGLCIQAPGESLKFPFPVEEEIQLDGRVS